VVATASLRGDGDLLAVPELRPELRAYFDGGQVREDGARHERVV